MNYELMLETLANGGIKFIVVGGYAAVAHGATFLTRDLDICYERSPENLKRIATLLQEIHARLRGAPEDLPFQLDERTLAQGMNFTFQTDYGDLDLLGELSGTGQYPDLARDAVTLRIFGKPCQVASVSAIIRSKIAAGRPKDLVAIPELEMIRNAEKPKKP